MKSRFIIGVTTLGVTLSFMTQGAFANEALLKDTDMVIKQETMEVNGNSKIQDGGEQVQKEEPLSPEEIREKTREEIKVEMAKIEAERAKQILEKVRKSKISREKEKELVGGQAEKVSTGLDNLFGNEEKKNIEAVTVKPVAVDTVSQVQAAPTEVAQVESKAKSNNFGERKVGVMPKGGLLMVKGDGIDFESKVNAGLVVEGDINERFTAGIGLRYAAMDLTDIAAQYQDQGGRQLKYNHAGVDLIGKFNLMTESRFIPYVGAILGFNRDHLTYEQNRDHLNGSGKTVAGNEDFVSSYLSLTALAGAKVALSKSVAMALEFEYGKGLTRSVGSSSVTQTDDQARLDRIGSMILDSQFASLTLGLMVNF